MMAWSEVPPTAGLPLKSSDFYGNHERLQDAVARRIGTPALQYECSGTVCLLITLLALRARAPDRHRVVVPAYTCPLVALAIHQAGLQTVPCDVRAGHFDCDAERLAELVDERTLAVIPTHLGGRLADIDSAIGVARHHGAYVIEDAAQALGASQHGRSVGLAGDAGFFSLAAGKGLTTFEGGLLVAGDDQLREELAWTSARVVRHRPFLDLRRSIEFIGYWICYRPSLLGLAYGSPRRRALARGDLIAAVGDRFPDRIACHRAGTWRGNVAARASVRLGDFLSVSAAQARRRIERLRRIPSIHVIQDAPGSGSGVWPMIMIVMADQASRDIALRQLWPSTWGVTRLFIHALSDYPQCAQLCSAGPLPNARDLASRLLTISNSAWLADADFEHIAVVLEQAA